LSLRLLRILYLRKDSFDSFTISKILNGGAGDDKSEKRTWKEISKLCKKRLKSYPTTLKNDKYLLKKEKNWLDMR
jgi:hypothetical protein